MPEKFQLWCDQNNLGATLGVFGFSFKGLVGVTLPTVIAATRPGLELQFGDQLQEPKKCGALIRC
jgi:hypothetical protein